MLGQRSVVRNAGLHRPTEPQRCGLNSASRQPRCGGVRKALQAPQAARPTRDSPSSLQHFESTASAGSTERLRDGSIFPPDRFLEHVSSSWAAFPSRSKLAVASHLAFAISNMVSKRATRLGYLVFGSEERGPRHRYFLHRGPHRGE